MNGNCGERCPTKHLKVDAAYLLSNVIPRLVPVEINPAASRGTLQGGLIDLVERMKAAFPPEVAISKAEWLGSRISMEPAFKVLVCYASSSLSKGAQVERGMIAIVIPKETSGSA